MKMKAGAVEVLWVGSMALGLNEIGSKYSIGTTV